MAGFRPLAEHVRASKIHRTEVTQCRMEPFFHCRPLPGTAVKRFTNVLEGLVVVQIHLFAFHRFDEALALGIVVGIATPAHRSTQAPTRPINTR